MRTITANSCGTTWRSDVLNAVNYEDVNVVDLDGKTLGIVANRKDARGGSRFFCADHLLACRRRISYDKLWARMNDWSDVISGQNARDYKRRMLVENDKQDPVLVGIDAHPKTGKEIDDYLHGRSVARPELPTANTLTDIQQARVQVALLVKFITDAPDRYTSMNPYGRPEVRAALKYLATGALGNAPTCDRLCDVDYEAADNTLRKLGVAIPYQAEHNELELTAAEAAWVAELEASAEENDIDDPPCSTVFEK